MPEVTVNKDIENKTLTVECVVNGPKEKVWKAYANKEWFEKWWGPEGFETTTKQHDFKPGGRVHYCMKCVDKNQTEWYGTESWGIMELLEVDAPNRFTANDAFSNPEGTVDTNIPTQRFEIDLVDEGGKTRIVSKSICDTAEQLEELVKMGMVEGFSSQLNKLEALLAE